MLLLNDVRIAINMCACVSETNERERKRIWIKRRGGLKKRKRKSVHELQSESCPKLYISNVQNVVLNLNNDNFYIINI